MKFVIKKKIVETYLSITIIFLAFTNVFLFEVLNTRVSLYIAFFLPFFLSITLLKGRLINVLNHSFILLALYITFSSLLNIDSLKFTSVIYSYIFIIYFIGLHLTMKASRFDVNMFLKAIKFILLSYFIVLILSQLLVLLDWYTLHTEIANFFQSSGPLGILYNNKTGVFRYQSLSSEPSYAAIIVILCYQTLLLFEISKRKRWIYGVMLAYMIIFFRSTFGIMLSLFLILHELKLNKKQFVVLMGCVTIILVVFFFTTLGGHSVDRLRNIVSLVFNSDNFLRDLNLIDSSAFHRLNPFFLYFKQANLLDWQFYFGHGANTSEAYFTKLIYKNSWESHLTFRPPFFPGFIYDYGILGVIITLGLILSMIKIKGNLFFVVLFSSILFNSNFNTQIFWFVITIYVISSYFVKTRFLPIVNHQNEAT